MAFLLEIQPKASFSHRPGGPAADRGKIAAILSRDAHWNKSSLNLRRTAGQGRRLVQLLKTIIAVASPPPRI
jgi:hypothetical protein